jgi:hypothetical protein
MKRTLLLLLFFVSSFSFSQTDSGDIETYLTTILSTMPDDSGNDYTIPTNGNLTTWESTINAILSDDIATARTHANSVNYEIVAYTNTSLSVHKVFYILKEKATQTNYWGTYVFSKNPERDDLVLQAPHSAFDFNTGKEAIYSFKRLNNKALFLNGTHRCNHSTASTCDGTTTVCSGSSEAFKISDMAHNTNTVFQKTTEILFNNISNSVFIQLHGFSKKSTDPYVILSNGTDITPAADYAVMLKTALLAADNSLTFKIAHIDTSWDRLRGFTNTQGRYINGSANPCNTSANATSGRFIHVEQEKSKLRQDATGWEKMNVALSNVFAKTLSVDEFSTEVLLKSNNPFKNSISFSAKNVIKVEVLNILGKSVYKKTTSKENITINTKYLSAGIYFLKVYTSNKTYTKKMIRE